MKVKIKMTAREKLLLYSVQEHGTGKDFERMIKSYEKERVLKHRYWRILCALRKQNKQIIYTEVLEDFTALQHKKEISHDIRFCFIQSRNNA